jgi:CheY-like chemotaxis protein/nitrogen-specific signal transduction histidine kinase
VSEPEHVRVLIEKLGLEITVRQVGGQPRKVVESQTGDEAARMELAARFAGGVAHELNNLLTAIGGFNELIITRMSDSNPLRRDAEEIERAVQRASTLTRRLLAIARRQVLQPVVLDPNTLLADLEPRLRAQAGDEVEVTVSLDPRTPRVMASPDQLQEVVLLLAESAVGEMGGKGSLRIESGADDSGAFARLAVSDTGAPPGEGERARVFEPFFADDRRRRGGGLALAAVYGMVLQSGGTLRIADAPGGGTTIAVELPAMNEPVSTAPRRATILLAEDEEPVRAMVRETLDRRGYEVLEAQDGAEALELAQAFTGEIHLVVTDVAMPGLTGLELVRALRQARPGLRVLYMSGSPGEEVARDLEVRAGTGFLSKPLVPSALALRVRQMLDEPIESAPLLDG